MLTTNELRDKLKNITCFALDLDGTTYLGNSLFPFTRKFLQRLEETDRQSLFITNNSSKAPQDYVIKLQQFGLPVKAEQIYTSADATIEYLKAKNTFHKLFILGTETLIASFRDNGFVIENEQPDALVLGFDLDFDYERFHKATNFLRQGVPFFATHPDFTCPMENGEVLPDCGAITAALSAATGVQPVVLGKPFQPMFNGILQRTQCKAENIAIVGDRLMTDIEIGRRNNVLSILVLTGETDHALLENSDTQPDFIVSSLEELLAFL